MSSMIASDYIEQVRKDGYVLIKRAIDPSIAQNLLDFATSFEYSDVERDALLKNQQRLNGYGNNIFNIALKRPDILPLFIRGVQGEIMKGLLNDRYYSSIPADLPNYIMRAMLLRSSLGAMPYHIDSFIPYQGDHTSVVQSAIFLNNSTIENGCTLLVPRSHLKGEYAPQGDNPDAIALEAEMGDIAIWDSRIWHATLENTAKTDRWALIGTFARWYIKQAFDYPRAISDQMYESLAVDEKIVYGYCSYTPLNEFEKTELKTGIDNIRRPSNSVK